MSVLENFNESMNAITTLNSFPLPSHQATFFELNASFLSKLLKSRHHLVVHLQEFDIIYIVLNFCKYIT